MADTKSALLNRDAYLVKKLPLKVQVRQNLFIYLLLLPAVAVTLVFSYLPLPGLLTAFMNFDMLQQFASPWVGLAHFREILEVPRFSRAVINTLSLSSVNLLAGTAASVLFALLINEIRNSLFKRFVQTVSYLPFFLAWISVIGMVYALCEEYGPINDLLVLCTGDESRRSILLTDNSLFLPLMVILSLWKSVGWGSVVYLAAIAGIDQQLYEAARIDGAGRVQQAVHITLQGIRNTVMILLILSMGSLITDNFELVYGLRNPFINFDVIGTVVFEQGITQGRYSLAAAFGLSQGLVQLLLVLAANFLSRKFGSISIF